MGHTILFVLSGVWASLYIPRLIFVTTPFKGVNLEHIEINVDDKGKIFDDIFKKR